MHRHAAHLVMAVVLSVGPASASGADEAQDWMCDGPVFTDPAVSAELDTIASNATLRDIVEEYVNRWDADYMRRACERAANGQQADMSCLNGRRDWTAIEAMIPREYFGMSPSALQPYYEAMSSEPNPTLVAYDYCVNLGVLSAELPWQ